MRGELARGERVPSLRHEWKSVDVDFNSGRGSATDGPPAPPFLVPGLVDVHCHGIEGCDVMDGGADQIGERLKALGVEWFCPTTVTASWPDLRCALQSVARGCMGFAGVHLEGPFINAEMAGAQPKQHVCAPSFSGLESELGELLDLVRIVTLAPEAPGADDLIFQLAERGVLVSAGHTNAQYEDLERAQRSGLSHMTHFYNRMRPFSHRDPGCVGFGLMEEVTCELIYDRCHVSRRAAELLFRCKGPYDVIAISDGTKLSALPDGTKAEMWGHGVTKRDGCARLPDGTLAGSCVTLADVFRNIWEDFGRDLAVLACSENPRRRLDLAAPELWLIVDRDGAILETRTGKLDLIESG